MFIVYDYWLYIITLMVYAPSIVYYQWFFDVPFIGFCYLAIATFIIRYIIKISEYNKCMLAINNIINICTNENYSEKSIPSNFTPFDFLIYYIVRNTQKIKYGAKKSNDCDFKEMLCGGYYVINGTEFYNTVVSLFKNNYFCRISSHESTCPEVCFMTIGGALLMGTIENDTWFQFESSGRTFYPSLVFTPNKNKIDQRFCESQTKNLNVGSKLDYIRGALHVSQLEDLIHDTIDFALYKITGKNVGKYGFSTFTEKNYIENKN